MDDDIIKSIEENNKKSLAKYIEEEIKKQNPNIIVVDDGGIKPHLLKMLELKPINDIILVDVIESMKIDEPLIRKVKKNKSNLSCIEPEQ